MKRGVVLSINKRFVTLLTPEGEFLKTKRQSRPYKVGEEISFSSVKQKFTFSFSSLNMPAKKTVVFSLASSFLILISVLPSFFTEHVSAYMTFDVNPSIELELNDELEVLKLTGLNSDGKLVIKEISNWKGKNVKVVTNRIVMTTRKLGYMEGKKQIVVSTTLLDDNKALDKNLKAEIKKVSRQENFAQTDLKVIPATKNDRKKAKEQGISTGKFVEKKLDKESSKNEKESKNVKEKAKETQVESSITGKNNNSRHNESPKNEAETIHIKKQVTEQKQKAIETNEKVKAKKIESHEKEYKVNLPKEKEIKKKQVKKENTPKHQGQKEEPPKQQRFKKNNPKQQVQKEKASKQRQDEKLLKQQAHKGKAPKQHGQKEKVSNRQVQKEETARQHPQRKNSPKQNQRGNQFNHRDLKESQDKK